MKPVFIELNKANRDDPMFVNIDNIALVTRYNRGSADYIRSAVYLTGCNDAFIFTESVGEIMKAIEEAKKGEK